MRKVSTLLLYLRIFHTKTTKKICHYLLGFVVVNGIWLFLSSVVTCVPLAAFWDSDTEGRCMPRSAMWILNASINIATDIGIFILPMPMISTLILAMRQKLGLYKYFVFGLGFL